MDIGVAGTSPARSNCSTTSSSPSKYITVVDVYDLAESINRDFEQLAEHVGRDPIECIVRKVICALETLEALVKNNDRDNTDIVDLQKTIEKLEHEKIQRIRDKDILEKDVADLEDNYKREIEDLCRRVKNLQTENKSMKRRLSTTASNEESASVSPEPGSAREEEFQALLELRHISMKQKEQIRDLQKDVETYCCEVDNLQNNIEKLIRQNKELLRKNSSLQKQGRMLVQERADLIRRLQHTEETNFQLRKVLNETSRACKDLESQRQYERESDDSPRFTLLELREVLQEKNSLKARVMELEEQLSYRNISSPSEADTDQNISTSDNLSKIQQAQEANETTMSSMSTLSPASTSTAATCEEENSEECVVYGPINREPDEKLHPWKYERKHSGVRRFFRFFKEINASGTLSPRRAASNPSTKLPG
ncbi:hypothetical protein Ddc_00533 [Ditylenchus destructor]|nr:hypothetical protein Ddc_00533 [Ditylenchus destructor]